MNDTESGEVESAIDIATKANQKSYWFHSFENNGVVLYYN
jgi:hypothetical protein